MTLRLLQLLLSLVGFVPAVTLALPLFGEEPGGEPAFYAFVTAALMFVVAAGFESVRLVTETLRE